MLGNFFLIIPINISELIRSSITHLHTKILYDFKKFNDTKLVITIDIYSITFYN